MRTICALLLIGVLPGVTAIARGANFAELNQPGKLVLAAGNGAAGSAAAASFYVAPNGKDSWSGKLAAPNASATDGPFASLAKAQIAVQELINAHPKGPVVVMLREGSYYLPLSPTNPGTLKFTARDSGTAQANVIWENYPGETPIVSGGESIGKGGLNLTWTHSSGNLWTEGDGK